MMVAMRARTSPTTASVRIGDVVAYPGRADLVAVSHDAADRYGVSQVMVSHQGNAIRSAGAVLDLTERAFVYRRTPDWNSID